MVSSFICLFHLPGGGLQAATALSFRRPRNTAADRASARVLSLIGPQLSGQSLVGAP